MFRRRAPRDGSPRRRPARRRRTDADTRSAGRGHGSASSSARRRRARPRWRCVFTVPSGRSVASAISASERSAKKRRARPPGKARRRGDGGTHRRIALRAERALGRIHGVGCAHGAEALPARLVGLGRERIEPRDLLPGLGAANGDADGDPAQPGPNAPSARQVPSERYAITNASCATSSASARSPRMRAQAETTAGLRGPRGSGRHCGPRRARHRRWCGHRSWLRCPVLWSRTGRQGSLRSAVPRVCPKSGLRGRPIRRPTDRRGSDRFPSQGRGHCQWSDRVSRRGRRSCSPPAPRRPPGTGPRRPSRPIGSRCSWNASGDASAAATSSTGVAYPSRGSCPRQRFHPSRTAAPAWRRRMPPLLRHRPRVPSGRRPG